MALPLTETDKFLLLSAVGAPETRDRIAALLDLAGTGNMTGPASATDNALVRFDGSTGALVQNSAALLDDSNNLSGLALLSLINIRTGNGSAGTPAYSFTSDPNTGFYSVSADRFMLSAGGADVFQIDGTLGASAIIKLNIPDGTASAPSLSFNSDTNTGLYRIGADNLGFSTAGTNVGSISSGLWTIGASGGTQTHAVNGVFSLIKGGVGSGGTGSILMTDVTTDANTKASSISLRHYTNAEENVGILAFESTSSTNVLYLGTGGTSSQNAMTNIQFWTAATNTTTLGTLRGSISAAGLWTIGTNNSTETHRVNGTSFRIDPNNNGDGSLQVRQANAGASAAALLYLETAGAGDTKVQYFVSGGADWAHGIDNSDNDAFKISNSATLGTNDYFRIGTGGQINIGASGGTQTHVINGNGQVNGQLFNTNYATAGSGTILYAQHTDNTNGASHSTIAALAGGTSGGDAVVRMDITGGGANWTMGVDNSDNDILKFQPNGSVGTSTALNIDTNLNVVMGNAALATTATNGFFYFETCAGTPTGVPTSYTGRVASIYDTSANKLWIYNGAWRSVTLA